ncbi:deoxyuridine 5'-triphosphate nucleotidohydrolase, mitochondrial isoform X2 [Hemicordylus capensis]|uniref:deoxyuridine 5'-triphosphate nucleotidohydrolase, mitochondrial isoform X2 n=1 Tax=Hemicordylus capensis TaxID=884348 RepID=UPI0023049885|nr:deoxyuridine 5'-triphosphate nucleotidohydrolase, mitochondrial isoform X2 [Hemicordylus capensis]
MPASEADAAAAASSPSKRRFAASRPEEPSQSLRFAKLSAHAVAPSRGSSRAAGYDLHSAYDCEIPSLGKAVVKTDIQIALPAGCYGRVAPRSGLAANHFIDVGAGVIDEDYRGNVGVVLFNFGKEPFKVKRGDRIAQLICERIYYPELEEVQALDDTERGSGGFGSTGHN